MLYSVSLMLVLLQVLACARAHVVSSSLSHLEGELAPELHEMSYELSDGLKGSTFVYVEPNVTSFYGDQDVSTRTSSATSKYFRGFAGKFFNLSPNNLARYWEESSGGRLHFMRNDHALSVSSTATFKGHRFVLTPIDDRETVVHRYIFGEMDNIKVYDPFYVEGDPEQTEQNLRLLSRSERKKYDALRRTLDYAKQYRDFTGRAYLANYLRPPPIHHMWQAGYFGQEHWVETSETHFVRDKQASTIGEAEISADGEGFVHNDSPLSLEDRLDGTLNLTLKVLSCAPRVFEIENFLSSDEVYHILEIANVHKLKSSSTGDGHNATTDTRKTRTSRNAWINRKETLVVDALYRRAADLLQIDEALMRDRTGQERPDIKSKGSMAEPIQLVHYEKGQEYKSHHDFSYKAFREHDQPARFATLLLYLNEGMYGGETSFPRWSNAETPLPLKVQPKIGKAVLFYSQLPDGNMDDLSQHAALPVVEGEKWLANFWVWDPFR